MDDPYVSRVTHNYYPSPNRAPPRSTPAQARPLRRVARAALHVGEADLPSRGERLFGLFGLLGLLEGGQGCKGGQGG